MDRGLNLGPYFLGKRYPAEALAAPHPEKDVCTVVRPIDMK